MLPIAPTDSQGKIFNAGCRGALRGASAVRAMACGRVTPTPELGRERSWTRVHGTGIVRSQTMVCAIAFDSDRWPLRDLEVDPVEVIRAHARRPSTRSRRACVSREHACLKKTPAPETARHKARLRFSALTERVRLRFFEQFGPGSGRLPVAAATQWRRAITQPHQYPSDATRPKASAPCSIAPARSVQASVSGRDLPARTDAAKVAATVHAAFYRVAQ